MHPSVSEETGVISSLTLGAGEEVVMTPADTPYPEALSVQPVLDQPALRNFFGARKPWRLYGLPIMQDNGSQVPPMV